MFHTAILWIAVPDPCWGVKQPQPPKERDSLSQDLPYQLLFLWYTSKVVPSSAQQKLLTCASDGVVFCGCYLPLKKVSHGRQCTGHLACALSCHGIKDSLFWRRVWDSIALLKWKADSGYFWLDSWKQTHPKCDKVWRKRPRARMSHIWSKWEIVARTRRVALAEEDEQPVQGAVLVPPSNAFFS